MRAARVAASLTANHYGRAHAPRRIGKIRNDHYLKRGRLSCTVGGLAIGGCTDARFECGEAIRPEGNQRPRPKTKRDNYRCVKVPQSGCSCGMR
jgi:hypothetical protein